MILPDANVLIYAFRSDSKEHHRYREWLNAVVNGSAAYGISPQVLCSVIRITTHPRIFAHPSQLDDALEFAEILMRQSNATLIEPGERHWLIFNDLCQNAATSGNLVQDAWFAALAIESGCEWITPDRDFARFRGLRWKPPF